MIFSLFSQAPDNIQNQNSPSPQAQRSINMVTKGRNYACIASLVSMATSSYFSVMAYNSEFSIPLYSMAALFLYTGYNGVQISFNLQEIILDPASCLAATRRCNIDAQKIKMAVKAYTIGGFDIFVDKGVDYLLKG